LELRPSVFYGSGRGNDERQHEVEIAEAFAIGVYPITQRQYEHVMGSRPSRFSSKGNAKDKVAGLITDEFPVENVTWFDALDFCRAVSLLPAIRDHGWVVDLSTEAEWEYACRAGTATAYHFGDSVSSLQANFNGNAPYGAAAKGPNLGRTSKVGNYDGNAWGLYDMHGNVFQWCKDRYEADYQHADAKGAPDRVARGGCFYVPGRECRAASRRHFLPESRNSATRMASPIGFRVVVRPRSK
jgi:formylglycine-generating enzyme required for sulfatase activity